jgi:hypothetical protein
MEDQEERVCFVCGNGPGPLGPLWDQQLQELGWVHDVCWPKYRELPDVRAFEEQQAQQKKEEKAAKEVWIREGRELGARRAGRKKEGEQIPFRVGDWLVNGEDQGFIRWVMSPDYREAEQLTGYKRDSLYKFAYVARHVPSCIRMQSLPWAMHQTVAPVGKQFGPDTQKKLLQHAEDARPRLSVAKFNAFVREKLAEQADLATLKARGVTTDSTANPNLPADKGVARYMRICGGLLPPLKLLESPMTPAVRADLVDKLKQTADALLKYAEKLMEWGERPAEDQWKESVYKFENDKRAMAAKARSTSASK